MYFILYYYFGVNVLRWCPIFHLFDTPFQNSRYGHDMILPFSNNCDEKLIFLLENFSECTTASSILM